MIGGDVPGFGSLRYLGAIKFLEALGLVATQLLKEHSFFGGALSFGDIQFGSIASGALSF